MNSILYAGNTFAVSINNTLTSEDKRVFSDAQKIIDTNNGNKKHTNTTLIILLVVFLVLIIFVCIFSTIFSLLNIHNDKIIGNVSIVGISISNLTKEEATYKINSSLSDRLSTDLILKHNDETYTLLPSTIECSFDINSIIDSAYSIGRNGNIIQNNYSIINSLIKNTDLVPSLIYNDDLLQSVIPQMEENFSDGLKNPSYTIDDDSLIITPGKDGNKILYNSLKHLLVDKLESVSYNTDPIIIPTQIQKCDNIDIDKIHSEVYKDAVDAYFTKDPYVIHASQTGLDFKVTIDEAKSIISTSANTYTIPLKTLYPKVTTNDISQEAFPDLLASFTTNYSSSSSNRATNVALATQKINGVVLMPGDTFSYNDTVGKRTVSTGFKEAGAYANGKVVNSVGGGICQVSSTLYNAVLRANLDIVDRSNHMFQVGYVPIGTDATVSWGAPDFKFKNSRSYPIKIVATTSNRNVYIKIYGLKESTEYEVEIKSYRTGTVAYKTTYTTDSSLASGQTKVIQSGSNGAKSETYRILKLNGEVISKTLLSRDTYDPHNQIIAKGP